MRVAIIGSRSCGDLTLEKILSHIPKETTSIVSGGAIGADSFARIVAKELKLPFEEYLPDYATFGKLAPIVRNKTIIDRADLVLAFWDYKSKGTKNALSEALNQNKKISIINIL